MKILFLAMTLALFASCNNSADQDNDMSDTTTLGPTKSDMNIDMGTDTTQSSIGDTSTFEGAANDSVGK